MTTVLLLLLLLMIKNKNTKRYKFGDLFEMQTGIVEDKYIMTVSETDVPVSIVRINSFTEDGGFNFESPEAQNDQAIAKTLYKQSQETSDLKTVADNKIIQENDFLLYTRGKPRGFSAVRFLDNRKEIYAATHHFIYLRPRTSIIDIHIPYLHLMMDLYTRKNISEHYAKKISKQKKGTAMANSVSIKELKDFEIILLTDVSEQEKVVAKYESQRNEYLKSLNNFQSLGDSILQNNFED